MYFVHQKATRVDPALHYREACSAVVSCRREGIAAGQAA